jgi:hypothetical protein
MRASPIVAILGTFLPLAAAPFTLPAPIIGRPDVPDSAYVALGARPEFAPVGHVATGGGGASGVLIGAHWMITAAHVVIDAKAESTFVELAGRRYAVRRIVIAPEYAAAKRVGGFAATAVDQALLELASDATIVPARLLTGTPDIGSLVTLVGFGNSIADAVTRGSAVAPSGEPAKRGAGPVKRAARNRLDQIGGAVHGMPLASNLFVFDLDVPGREAWNATGTTAAEPLEGVGTGGDSGGGLFVEQGGHWFLAATFSVSSTNMGDVMDGIWAGTVNVCVGLAPQRAWIAATTGIGIAARER